MKRVVDSDKESSSKRPRTISTDATDPFDPTLEKKVTDLYANGTDGTGFFSATVFMTWPIKQKTRLNLETVVDKKIHRFDIELSGKCAPHFDKLKFCSRDVFQIALKGAKIEKNQSSSSPFSLPMTVRYPEGVVLKFITTKPTEIGQVVDTWKLQEAEESRQDDWFSTPIKSSDVPMQTSEVTAVPHENPPPEPILTKKKSRRLRRQRRAREAAAAAKLTAGRPGPTDPTPENPAQPVVADVEPPDPALVVSGSTSNLTPEQPAPVEVAAEVEPCNPALNFEVAVFLNEDRDPYVPISELQDKKFYNIIGVVTSSGLARRTSTGEWFRCLTVVDPSLCGANDGYMQSEVVKVNCFTKKYEEWLPSAQEGDILILRKVKADFFEGKRALTGQSYKLRWAVFDPETGKVRPRNLGNAPESEGLADGFGFQCDPFWKPKDSELAYCLKMADWWREVQKIRQKELGEVHQIGGNNGTMTTRQHRLICDASPNLPPNGFFDCTVEILHGYMNPNGVYSLFVTDYTANHEITPVQASWCPPRLADRVLKIELWDGASERGPMMAPGEYYSISNNRLKVSRGGFVEGTFSQPRKLRRLYEPDGPHLQALLERKKNWESANPTSVSNPFKHRLIQEVDSDMFFNCTVEILHAAHNAPKPSFLYITDYTAHPDLPANALDGESWSSGLAGRIVKVSLWETQIDMAKNVEPGAFYSILSLRLKRNLTGNEFQGRLGGNERLIHKLKDADTTNEELKALIARKEEWKKATVKCAVAERKPQQTNDADSTSEEPAKQTAPCALSLLKRSPHSTIQEVLTSDKCPNKFCVIARVIDYYPLNLEECVVQQCTKCGMDVPAKYKACLDCNDDDHEFIKYLYRFFFRLEDEDGRRIHVAVSDEKCSLLQGLKPINLQDDLDARQKFAERLGPVIGNLVEVHNGRLRDVRIAPDTPMLRFTIESWDISISDRPTRAYGLVSHMMA